MNHESEIIITSNQVETGSPGEFLLRVRAIATILRRFRTGQAVTEQNPTAQASAVLFDDLAVEITSPNQQEFMLTFHRADTDTVTNISYLGSSLFVQRGEDEEPQQMAPDAEGFGVIQFVNTVIDKLDKETHPENDAIW